MRSILTALVSTAALLLCAATVHAQSPEKALEEQLKRIKATPDTADFEAGIGYLDREMKSKDFRDRYAKVSLELKAYYQVVAMSGMISDEWQQKWNSHISRWSSTNPNRFTNKEMFYLAGLPVILNEREQGLNSNEDFKSKVIGNYQCMNIQAATADQIKNAVRINGTVKESLLNCGLLRIAY
jgi:hypothetical protein